MQLLFCIKLIKRHYSFATKIKRQEQDLLQRKVEIRVFLTTSRCSSYFVSNPSRESPWKTSNSTNAITLGRQMKIEYNSQQKHHRHGRRNFISITKTVYLTLPYVLISRYSYIDNRTVTKRGDILSPQQSSNRMKDIAFAREANNDF